MVAISESDDDDLSSHIKSTKKHRHFTKRSKNKIEDSDSSSDEKLEEILDNNSPKDENYINKSNEEDEVSQDHLVIDELDESCKEQLTCVVTTSTQKSSKINESGIDESALNDDSSMDRDENEASLQITDDNEHSDENKTINKKLQKKKGRTKQCCFDDSSDDEGVEAISKEKKRKSSQRRKSNLNSTLIPKENKNEDEDDGEINEASLQITDDNEHSDEKHESQGSQRRESNLNSMPDADLEDKILEDDIFISNLMKNRDIFDAEDEDEMRNYGSDDESLKQKKESRKEKRPKKSAVQEAKSEQQRLLREQKFKLPYHMPEAKPLKDFLLRVPLLKRKEKKRKQQPHSDEKEAITIDNDSIVNNEIVEDGAESIVAKSDEPEAVSKKEGSGIENLFKQKPKLSFGNKECIEFEEMIELDDVNTNQEVKKIGVLDLFMARFEKHTKGTRMKNMLNKGATSVDPSGVNVVIPEKEKIPGGRRIAFAEQMKLKIRKERAKTLKELEREKKLLNEDNSTEEEEEEDEFDDEEDTDEEERDEGDEEVAGGKDAESSDDEELSKWNLDDQRKALEVEMEEEEKARKVSETITNSVDFSVETPKSPPPYPQKEDDIHWDDSSSTVSSVLPAGQGEPTGRKNSTDGRMTPFSKLVNSGLFDSTSHLNYNSSSQGPVAGITLPCEDTQDLYKEEKKNEEESQMVSSSLSSFQLNLDEEESQYTQVIDSQGFFNDPKKSKIRHLFDKEGGCTNDFSQVIGMCSGKFDDVASGTISKCESEGNGIYNKGGAFSMTQVIGLCSGKFSDDDDAMTSSKDNPTCQTNTDGHDEGSLSNPPWEHPFSSRVEVNNKSADKPVQFCDTPENMFSLDVEKTMEGKSGKPLGLTYILDDNFDDNAIDFCTAPFSGQVTGEESESVDGSELKNDMVSSQTKFDVGNWLKKDNKHGSSESVSDVDANHENIENVEEDNDDDDVFADNEEGVYDEDDDGDGGGDDGGNEYDSDGEDNDGDTKTTNNGDNEDAAEDSEGGENEVNEELLEYQDAIARKPKKWSKSAFMEKEAELSGSDINSDAEDLGSEYDEYEIDSEVEDLPSGEKLKEQVHKIHQKRLLDQDAREVRLLQELYIEDADRGYGKKRQRNFKWKNMADDGATFNTSGHSDDDEEELNTETNLSQKLERAEREKYISELQERDKATMDENSQSMLEMIKDPAAFIAEKTAPTLKPKVTKVDGRALSQKRSGSFMSQAKSSFSHLSSAMKVGGQGGKAFVFQASEGEKEMSADKENKDVNRKTPNTSEPARKRTKLESHVETSESQSIFDHY